MATTATVVRMMNVTVVVSTKDATPTTYTLTNQTDKFQLDLKYDIKDRTTFGNTWAIMGTGNSSGTGSLEVFVGFNAGGVNDCFSNIFFNKAGLGHMVVTESGSAHSFTFDFVLPQWTPLSGGTNDDDKTSVPFTVTGAVTYV